MKHLTPMKAIRAKCLDCSHGQPGEVRMCPVISCALWPYRMGKRPSQHEQQVYAGQEVSTCVG